MQELGETRTQMTRDLMKRVESIISTTKCEDYYILVHAKPFPQHPQMIKIKYLIMDQKPSMMLSCLLFHVDNKKGKLELCWALAGDWPVWACGGMNEPIPEVIASYDRLDRVLKMKKGNSFFEDSETSCALAKCEGN